MGYCGVGVGVYSLYGLMWFSGWHLSPYMGYSGVVVVSMPLYGLLWCSGWHLFPYMGYCGVIVGIYTLIWVTVM